MQQQLQHQLPLRQGGQNACDQAWWLHQVPTVEERRARGDADDEEGRPGDDAMDGYRFSR